MGKQLRQRRQQSQSQTGAKKLHSKLYKMAKSNRKHIKSVLASLKPTKSIK